MHSLSVQWNRGRGRHTRTHTHTHARTCGGIRPGRKDGCSDGHLRARASSRRSDPGASPFLAWARSSFTSASSSSASFPSARSYVCGCFWNHHGGSTNPPPAAPPDLHPASSPSPMPLLADDGERTRLSPPPRAPSSSLSPLAVLADLVSPRDVSALSLASLSARSLFLS